jgi:hypothetical protein
VSIFWRSSNAKRTHLIFNSYLAEEATIKKGVEALIRELGPVEAMRFLGIPRERRQESVKRHREWQKTLDKKKLFDEVFG